MRGYVVVLEGDDGSGWSAYSPDLPGVVAAAGSRAETEDLMREAMTGHVAVLRESGLPVPAPSQVSAVTVVELPAA
ncbi:MAG: type II toxin-antitoxin system HicB family antitoxin [Pseudonocardia sp.]|nr:type II toxin-antitoxin system HicB family antitoxin [Pseudonocardia sp.]